jgi:hypothetical protein
MLKSAKKDVLRTDDMYGMKELMSKMNKFRVEDKVAFK